MGPLPCFRHAGPGHPQRFQKEASVRVQPPGGVAAQGTVEVHGGGNDLGIGPSLIASERARAQGVVFRGLQKGVMERIYHIIYNII